MELLLCTVGKPKLAYAAAGAGEYLDRLRRYGRVDWKTAKPGGREEEGARLLALSEGCERVALHGAGEFFSSEGLADFLTGKENGATRRMAFLVGGADGHGPALLAACRHVWSLGPATLQHELALVVALEQLYRARTIQRNEPYHRA